MNSYKIEIIKLDQLLINPENFRYNPVENQYEALETMIKEQGEKVTNLIKDIIDNGLNPTELIAVTQLDNSYVVLEGNRRVTSLKIINNPDIIKDIDKKMCNRVNNLLQNKSTHLETEIMCAVFEKEEDSYKWIDLKHTGENKGKGTVPWDTESKRRFDLKTSGKKPVALQLIDFIKESDKFNKEQKEAIDEISITNIERLIGDPHVRETLGFTLKKGELNKIYPDNELTKGLSKLVADLSKKDFSVKDIYTKDKRLDYISEFNLENLPDVNKKLDKEVKLVNNQELMDNANNYSNKNKIEESKEDSVQINILDKIEDNIDETSNKDSKNSGEVKQSNKIRDKKFSYDRKYLIPTNFIVKISNRRINDIYKELKSLEVSKFTNAAAILFRVFIELSVDEYIQKQNTKEIDENAKLNKKLQWVLESLRKKNLITDNEAKPVNKAISSPNSITSINTFNSYVHNKDIYPSPKELIISWNNFQVFVSALWKAL
ncbi:hypothetical protein JOC70_000748 [Clostridium pascui]|uniref:hypothetical protein n=1 Tax=Clostridium pascui TaxID=46609 RepID=UPI00195A34F4|nr:hypothetical protein [Clostridium pascui]MBM7869279.1 hypothetical protein [Clostridium pascui]